MLLIILGTYFASSENTFLFIYFGLNNVVFLWGHVTLTFQNQEVIGQFLDELRFQASGIQIMSIILKI